MVGKLRGILGLLFTATLIGNAACSGDTGPAGPKGDPGDKGDPGTDGSGGNGGGGQASESISAVLPGKAFLGRTIDVTIVGNNTQFKDGVVPDFGDGITVKNAIVASPTALIATIEIGDGATEGVRDVKVGSDTYKGAFNVSSPLKVTTEIPVQQGGYVIANIEQLDLSTPFTADATISSTSGDIVLSPVASAAYSITAYIQADVLAKAGSVGLTVKDDAADSPAPKAFSITARTPKVIAVGTQETGNIASASFTALYKYTPAAGANIAHVVVGTDPASDEGPAAFALLPKSGKWKDQLALSVDEFVSISGTDPLYIVAFDAPGDVSSPYAYSVDVSELTVTNATEVEPNNSPVLANAITSPTIYSGDVASGADYVKVVVTGAPKTINVAQFDDGTTDVDLTLYGVDGITVIDDEDAWPDFFGDPGKERIQQTIAVDGTYYISVNQGFGFDPSSSTYKILVSVE